MSERGGTDSHSSSFPSESYDPRTGLVVNRKISSTGIVETSWVTEDRIFEKKLFKIDWDIVDKLSEEDSAPSILPRVTRDYPFGDSIILNSQVPSQERSVEIRTRPGGSLDEIHVSLDLGDEDDESRTDITYDSYGSLSEISISPSEKITDEANERAYGLESSERFAKLTRLYEAEGVAAFIPGRSEQTANGVLEIMSEDISDRFLSPFDQSIRSKIVSGIDHVVSRYMDEYGEALSLGKKNEFERVFKISFISNLSLRPINSTGLQDENVIEDAMGSFMAHSLVWYEEALFGNSLEIDVSNGGFSISIVNDDFEKIADLEVDDEGRFSFGAYKFSLVEEEDALVLSKFRGKSSESIRISRNIDTGNTMEDAGSLDTQRWEKVLDSFVKFA